MSWIAAIRSTRPPKCDQDPPKKLPPSGRPRPRSRATQRAAELPASEREAFIEFIIEEVDFEMTRFYAVIAWSTSSRRASCRRWRPSPPRRKVDRRWPSCLPSAPSSPRLSSARLRTPSATFGSADQTSKWYQARFARALLRGKPPARPIRGVSVAPRLGACRVRRSRRLTSSSLRTNPLEKSRSPSGHASPISVPCGPPYRRSSGRRSDRRRSDPVSHEDVSSLPISEWAPADRE